MGFNGTNSGQWIQPDLFYTFQTVVPFSGDTIEFIMIDTVSLIGGVNNMPSVLPSLFYPPPAPNGAGFAAAAGPTAAAARATTYTRGASVYGTARAMSPTPAPVAKYVAASPVAAPAAATYPTVTAAAPAVVN